ncbi:hypothetical protein K2Q16_04680 [Patescibacteria group bacterium]|nr:hypothetical protein [Patescibacteria group bacterium]
MPTKKVASVATPKKAVVPSVKKSTAKARVPALAYASNEQSFWTASGEILNSLPSLRDAFAVMSKETFSHHVGARKHDFATWVHDVLGDSACASDLRKAKTTASARAVIVRHLKRYEL